MRRGLTLVHPYDDEKVIAGQGTIALEMLAAQPELDVLVVPIGGGGIIAGHGAGGQGVEPGNRGGRRARPALSLDVLRDSKGWAASSAPPPSPTASRSRSPAGSPCRSCASW